MPLPPDVARAIEQAVAHVPNAPTVLGYGTAGFRAKATLLDAVFIRVGILAALRAAHTGRAIGVMVTASHNPVQDNGVKIVDPDGGMLVRRWEKYACDLAGAAPADVASVVDAIVRAEAIDVAAAAAPRAVHIAKDTRPSSESLSQRVRAGAEALGAAVTDHGLLTTPQLHYIVRATNAGGAASVTGYVEAMRAAFAEVLGGSGSSGPARGPIVIDCANGVGGLAGVAVAAAMGGLGLEMRLRNTGRTEAEVASMNEGCGAEHAQKERLPPLGFSAAADAGLRCASLDGDADRLVYHFFDSPAAGGAWRLVDGDKIATLAATFVAEQLRGLGLAVTGEPAHPHAAEDYDPFAPGSHGHVAGPSSGAADAPVSVGVVQTAYANGASTAYIRKSLGLPVVLTKTGVKFLHHAAQGFDIGIYFEANGHGTVLFHPAFLARLRAMDCGAPGSPQDCARRRLLASSVLINQAVGDALSDLLFAEAVLALKGWSVQDWDVLYSDLPSRQTKLAVRDRAVVVTTEDETTVVAPRELQADIDSLVAATPKGRAFVRPSGTEDVVRVYAEAETQAHADALASAVAKAAHALAGGVGSPPP